MAHVPATAGLAEEIAQDVFLELDRNLGRIESADHACFWLTAGSDEPVNRRAAKTEGAGVDLLVEMDESMERRRVRSRT